jgi:hypothetical protein
VLSHYEDALGGLGIVAKERANLAQSLEEALNLVEFCAGACVVRVPRLLRLRELGLELTDERQNAYSIGKHGQWVSLGHAFFAEDKDGVTVVASKHKYRPVFVAVAHKPGPGRPLVSDRPQHFDPVLLIECVGRINEQGSPIFLGFVQIPEGLHRMDAALYACFKSSTELLVDAAGLLGFSSCHKEENFRRSTAPTFANANWTDTRAFFQGTEPP